MARNKDTRPVWAVIQYQFSKRKTERNLIGPYTTSAEAWKDMRRNAKHFYPWGGGYTVKFSTLRATLEEAIAIDEGAGRRYFCY